MSKVKITGHASGTGVLTVTAPNTSSDRTITLPDATGTLLNSDGDGSSLTGVGGAWTLIGTNVASDSASLTQTGLDSTYDLYCIAVSDMVPASDNQGLNLRCGDSGGVDSGASDYAHHSHRSTDDSTAYAGLSDTGRSEMPFGRNGGSAAGEGVGFIAWLHRPGDGTTFPTFSWSGCSVEADSTISMCAGGGARLSAITLDRINVFFTSGNIASGRMTVWGVSHT